MEEIIIRRAEEMDVKAIAEMDRLCFSLPWSENSFFEEITKNHVAVYLVAERAGRIVGYAGVWLILDEGHITNVAVHPDFRRSGIAQCLVRRLTCGSETNNIQIYTLEVRASNHAAIALYEKMGFRECGVRKAYYEDNNEDALIMWKQGQETAN